MGGGGGPYRNTCALFRLTWLGARNVGISDSNIFLALSNMNLYSFFCNVTFPSISSLFVPSKVG